MKKRIIIISITVVIILISITFIWCYVKSHDEKNMSYKFEENDLYITVNGEEWIEVPGDFSHTANHLNEINGGRYRDNTYQMNNNKIVFYREIETLESYQKSGGRRYITYLVYSDDRGKTWKEADCLRPTDLPDTIKSIYFKNKNEGEMIVYDEINNQNELLTTMNGGEAWNFKEVVQD